MKKNGTWLKRIGRNLANRFKDLINVLTLGVLSLFSVIKNWNIGHKLFIENILKQILYTGVLALVTIGFLGLVIGAVIAQLLDLFPSNPFIASGLQSGLMVFLIVKLFGPIFTLFILIARSGTAICIEIGNMKVNHELEALEIMGINVLHYVIAPRIIGMIISALSLYIYFIIFAIIGSLTLTSLQQNVNWIDFFDKFFKILSFNDLLVAFFYMAGFGFIIGSIGCYQGLQVKISSTEVPFQTIQAVVRCIIWCLFYYVYVTIIAIQSGGWLDF